MTYRSPKRRRIHEFSPLNLTGLTRVHGSAVNYEMEEELCPLPFVPSGFRDPDNPPKPLQHCIRVDSSAYVPRAWASKVLGVTNCGEVGREVSVPFVGDLLPEKRQPEAVETVLKVIREDYGAILSVPTGYGKTAMSLKIISELGRLALFVVNTGDLLEQAVRAFRKFSPDVRIGVIQGTVYQVDNVDIVVGMMQTLASRMPDMSMFGTLVIDEAHTVCCRWLSRCLFNCPARYRLAVSATPKRADGMERVLNWHFGSGGFFLREDSSSRSFRPSVRRINFGSRYVPSGSLSRVSIISSLCDSRPRNSIITDVITDAYREGRRIMCGSERKDQLTLLRAMLVFSDVVEDDILILTADTKNRRELVLSNYRIILGTYKLIETGLNVPEFDTAVWCSPRSKAQQFCGRVLREHPDKKVPLIIDFVDEHPLFRNSHSARMRYFREAGFRVTRE